MGKEREKEIPLQASQDTPPCGGSCERTIVQKHVVVDVPLDWPVIASNGIPYTPPPEDYEKVVEASLGTSIEQLGILATAEVDRIYHDGLLGRARGYGKKSIPFRNWVAYVVKCLWTAYNKGLLRGCRPPKTVLVRG